MSTPPTPNTITFEEVMEVADLLGSQHGQSKDVLIKSLLKCCEAAYHGALTTQKNKHGKDRDDASMYAERYFKARNENVIFDPKADNQQKLACTIRTAVKLGSSPKFGNGEPIATVNQLMSLFQKEKAATKGKVDSADNVFLKFARAQLAHDIMYEGDELKQFLYKKEKQEPTLEEYLENTAKKLDKLITGDAPGNLQSKSKNVMDARHALRQELAAIARAKSKGGV
jgi:hypothetical protein